MDRGKSRLKSCVKNIGFNYSFILSAGNPFWRLLLPPIVPSSTSVEVTASSSRIEAAPGESVKAEFVVTNFGEATTVQIEIADDKTYLASFTPQT
jgi:hypothetical protein